MNTKEKTRKKESCCKHQENQRSTTIDEWSIEEEPNLLAINPTGGINRIFTSPYTYLVTIMVLILLAYSNTLNAPFIFDDVDNISNNWTIRWQTISWENFQNILKSLNGKRPISLITLGINYYFDGYNVFWYHITNLVIHIINSLLLFFIIKEILQLYCSSSNKYLRDLENNKNKLIALFSMSLWALNPIQIYSVTYTIQRMNSLSAMFSLIAIFIYIKIRTMSFDNKKLHFFMVISCFIMLLSVASLAVLSKQNAILLPFFIILIEIFFIQKFKILCFKNLLNNKIQTMLITISVLIILGIVIGFIYYNTATNPWKHILSLYHGRDFSPKERLLTQPRIVLYYLSLIFYPSPDRLTFLVNIPKSTSFLVPITTIYAIIFHFSIIIFSLIFAKKYPILSFSILWFYIGHILESTIIPLELVYIHRNYLPSMFLFLPIIWGLYHCSYKKVIIFEKYKYVIIIFLSGSILLFTTWTYQYNKIWSTEVSFWADNVKKSPKLGRPHANYGIALFKAGRIKEAHTEYDLTLKIKPNDTRTHYNKGVAYEAEKKYEKALYSYSKALRANKIFADAWCNQGNVLIELGDLDNGLNCLYQAWELQPFDTHTNYSLGHALIQANNTKGALFHLNRAKQIDPKYVEPLLDLALIYTILEHKEVAIKYYKEVLKLDPDNKIANLFLQLKSNQ